MLRGERILIVMKADTTGEMVSEDYGISTDDVAKAGSERFLGLGERENEGKLFRKHQLVRTCNGEDAVITFLSFRSAQIVTVENQIKSTLLHDLQPVVMKRMAIVTDGSSPPVSIGVLSQVQIRGDAQRKGKVIQVS